MATYSGHFRDAKNRNIFLSYSFYFSTAGSVHRVFLLREEGTRAKVSHSEWKGSSSARLEEDPICRSYALLGSVYVVNTRDSVSRGNSTRKIPRARDAAIA